MCRYNKEQFELVMKMTFLEYVPVRRSGKRSRSCPPTLRRGLEEIEDGIEKALEKEMDKMQSATEVEDDIEKAPEKEMDKMQSATEDTAIGEGRQDARSESVQPAKGDAKDAEAQKRPALLLFPEWHPRKRGLQRELQGSSKRTWQR